MPARAQRNTPGGRVPPHDIEAEQSVLGAVLLAPAALADCAHLAERAFYRDAHRTIWKTIRGLADAGAPVDAISVAAALQRNGDLEEVGGRAYLHSLVAIVPHASAAGHYARVVEHNALLRELIDHATEIAQTAYDGVEDTVGLAAYARSLFATLEAFPPSFTPIDVASLLAAGIPAVDWLSEPYVPAGARVWAFGPAESGKSMWALATACELTRQGVNVLYVSQENPLEVDLRRLSRLSPALDRLIFLHDIGLDLARADQRAALHSMVREHKARLVVLDTLSAVWSGDEADNAQIAAFDRDTLIPIRDAGCASIVLDHTGNPVAFVKRRGVTAGRGASSKGQKADVVLEFRTEGAQGFVIEHAKDRIGGVKQAPRAFKVVDAEDGSLQIVVSEHRLSDEEVPECAEAIVSVIYETPGLTTKQLHARIRGYGQSIRSAAMAWLRAEEPPRVVVRDEKSASGQRAKCWRPAEEGML